MRRVDGATGAVVAVAIAAALAAGAAAAGQPRGDVADAAPPPTRAAVAARFGPPVADAALAGLRGGFLSLDGRVSIAFGLRQTVAIDGVTAVTAGAATAGAAATAAGAGQLPLLLVQAGAGNAASVPTTATGLVLQNALPGRQLQVQRVIDVSVDSLQRLQGIALQRDVVNGLVGSLRR